MNRKTIFLGPVITGVILLFVLFQPGLIPSSQALLGETSTPTATETPVGGNVIGNPGFESGPGGGWTEFSGANREIVTTSLPHTGLYSADECNYDLCTEYVQQQVVVPTSGTLTFWWYLASQDSTTTAHDFFKVELYRPDGTLLQSLRTRNNTVRRNQWLQDSIDLSTRAGQTVILRFTTTTDAALPSRFPVDDVALQSPQPTPTPTPTMTAIGGYQFLSTVIVPVTGASAQSSITLDAGVNYKLRASGTFISGGPGFGDAEYFFDTSFATIWNTCNNSPSGVDLGIGINDTANDNSKSPFWGPFDPSHVYIIDYLGQGTTITLNFNYHDCSYGENSGSLTVEIFGPVGALATVTPTFTATPTDTPTSTSTPTPTNTSTPTRTPVPSNTPTNTRTPSNTPTQTNTSTNTRTPSPTRTPTNTSTSTPTPTSTLTPPAGYLFLETVVVPANGVTVVSANPLQAGIPYKLRASGTFTTGGPGFGDAEYFFDSSLTTIWNNCNNSPTGVDVGIGVNDPVNDSNKAPFWGAFSASHIYTIDYLGQGGQVGLSLNYHDCQPSDNVGSLTVEIFAPAQPVASATPTFSVTPTSTPTFTPTPSRELLNAGFESGPGLGWAEFSSTGREQITANLPHTGEYSADQCNYNLCTEYIQQQLTVPSGASITYWWVMTSQDSTTAAHDVFKVELYRLDGSLYQTLRNRNNTVRRGSWLQDSFDLSAQAGQTLWLRFTTTTDGALPTRFFVDDVLLTSPTPTPTLTPLTDLPRLDTIIVPASGAAVTSQISLQSGLVYRLRASGVFTSGGPGFGDAEYFFDSSLSTVWDTCDGTPSGVDVGIGINDTINDTSKQPYWGSFAADHAYTTDYGGQGSPITLSFNVHDCNYSDNAGSLAVEIFGPLPTPTPTATPTFTPSPTDTLTATPTATDTPTSTFTATNTFTPTDTPTATPTATDTPTSTFTATNTATSTDTPTATHTPTDTPTSTFTATNTSTPTDTPTPTPTPNSPPSADSGGPYIVDEGSSMALMADGRDLEGGPLDFVWDLDQDGIFETPGQSVAFSAADLDGPASYPVAVQVTDAGGLATVAETVITIRNVAPVASLTNAGPVTEGAPVLISLSTAFDPSAADAAAGWHYAFACDGSSLEAITYDTSTVAPQQTCTFADGPSMPTVRARIFDQDGGFTEYTTGVQVDNFNPRIVRLDHNQQVLPADEGVVDPVDVGDFTDSAADSPWTILIDWGDGSDVTRYTLTAPGDLGMQSHRFEDNGLYPVTVTVIDKDGGSSSRGISISVANLAPVATFQAPAEVDEGSAILLSLTDAADSSPADSAAGFTYAFDCGDGMGYGIFTSQGATTCPTVDNDLRTVKGQIRDKDGDLTEYSASVSVRNIAPSVSLGTVPVSSPEGGPIDLIAMASDPGTADTLIYAWTVTKDGQLFALGTDLNVRFIPDDNGSYTVTLSGTDDDGGVGTDTRTLQVTNVNPTATVQSAPGSGSEGATIDLTATASDPSAVDTLTYTWLVTKNDQPFTLGTGSSLSFMPDDNGTYTVTLAVTDDDGGVGTDARTIQVTNVSPTVAIVGAPDSSPEGAALNFASSVVDPGQNDTFTYAWTVTKNGIPFSSSAERELAFTPDDNGAYLVNLTATDNDGGAGVASHTVVVTNVQPMIASVITDHHGPIYEGQTVTVIANANDAAGANDPLQYQFDCDNNSVYEIGPQSDHSAPCHFNLYGSYTVNVQVTDDDGGATTGAITLSVGDIAPTITSLASNGPINEGQSAIITILAADPGAPFDILQYQFDCNNDDVYEIGPQAANSAACTFQDNGSYTVNVRVTDSDGGEATGSLPVVVNDVVALVHAGNSLIGYEGDLVTLAPATFSDMGTLDTHTASINWGDGSPAQAGQVSESNGSGTAFGSHVYVAPGVYTITVSVVDKDGGVGTSTFTITVVHGFLRDCAYSSNDPLTLQDYASVTSCNLSSQGKISINKNANVTGAIESRTDQVIIDMDSVIRGQVTALNSVELHQRVSTVGNISSGQDVHLHQDSVVQGAVSATHQVQLDPGATVNGAVTNGAPLPVFPSITQVQLALTPAGADVTVNDRSVLTLPPGSYGRLKLKTSATLNLNSGRYQFTSIDADRYATFNLDLSALPGTLVIDVVQDITLQDSARMTIVSAAGSPESILFRVQGHQVDLRNNGVFLGTVVAPNANIELRDYARLTGALYGKKVSIDKHTQVTGQPALGLFINQFVAP